MKPINEATVKSLLSVVDQGLASGLGSPKPGYMCVEAAVCYSLGLPHGDNPTCVDPAIRSLKIRLNDSRWSSKKARAKGLRKLAVLQLGTRDCFDDRGFIKRVALMTIKTILPITLAAAGLHSHAAACSSASTLTEARAAAYAARAAARAAAYAADTARAAAYAADTAAYAAARAAAYAAYAADTADTADAILQQFSDNVAQILIDMNVPAVKFLYLLK